MRNFLHDFLRRSPRPAESELVVELRREVRTLESDRAAAVRSNLALAERVGERTAQRDEAIERCEELKRAMERLAPGRPAIDVRPAIERALAIKPASNPCPAVRNDWLDWNAKWEGREHEMYLDVEGYVTTGIGFLLLTAQAAMSYNWRRPTDQGLATDEQITIEWNRVHSMKKGELATYYHVPGALYLDDRDIDNECLKRFDQDAEVLLGFFPDLASLPEAAQRAIMSMAWALGAGFPRTWPKFTTAVRARDWATAATECVIPARGNVAWTARNKVNVSLLLGLIPAAPTA